MPIASAVEEVLYSHVRSKLKGEKGGHQSRQRSKIGARRQLAALRRHSAGLNCEAHL